MQCSTLLHSLWRKSQRLMDKILRLNSEDHFFITYNNYCFYVMSLQSFIIFLFQTQPHCSEKMREYMRKQKKHSLIPCKAYNAYKRSTYMQKIIRFLITYAQMFKFLNLNCMKLHGKQANFGKFHRKMIPFIA